MELSSCALIIGEDKDVITSAEAILSKLQRKALFALTVEQTQRVLDENKYIDIAVFLLANFDPEILNLLRTRNPSCEAVCLFEHKDCESVPWDTLGELDVKSALLSSPKAIASTLKATIRTAEKNRDIRIARTENDRLEIRAKAQLEIFSQANTFLHAVFADANCGILTTDSNGTIQLWNPEAQRITGYTLSEIYGEGAEILFESTEDNILTRGYKSVIDKTTEICSRSGEKVPVLLRLSPLETEKNELPGYSICFVDLRERIHLEKELARIQRIDTLGSLASGMAHEFNNVITAISGWGALLQIRAESPLQVKTYATEIIKESERARHLTGQLMDLAIETSPLVDSISPAKIIHKVLSLMQGTLESCAEIRLEGIDSLPHIKVNAAQVQQVFVNLFLNAKQAMPHGGILTIGGECIDIEEDEATQSKTIAPGKYVHLWIRDTGCGVPTPLRDKVFEPFFTTKNTTDNSASGMGLTVSLRLARNQGGWLYLGETPSKEGLSVELMLPVDSTATAPQALTMDDSEENILPSFSGNVLVVEDEDGVRFVTMELLSLLGFSPDGASGGEEALDFIDANPKYDLIILDQCMPEPDGLATLGALRRQQIGTPVIFVSGNKLNNETVSMIEDLQPTVFLKKPYDLQKLTQSIIGAGIKTDEKNEEN